METDDSCNGVIDGGYHCSHCWYVVLDVAKNLGLGCRRRRNGEVLWSAATLNAQRIVS